MWNSSLNGQINTLEPIVGDALQLPSRDHAFDAVCTSPALGKSHGGSLQCQGRFHPPHIYPRTRQKASPRLLRRDAVRRTLSEFPQKSMEGSIEGPQAERRGLVVKEGDSFTTRSETMTLEIPETLEPPLRRFARSIEGISKHCWRLSCVRTCSGCNPILVPQRLESTSSCMTFSG